MKLKYLLLILSTIFICAYQHIYGSEQQANYKTHVVLKGETIYSIASTYKVKVQELYKLNPDVEKGIKPDQLIRIPSEKVSASVSSSNSYVLHSIQAKETLYSVSKKYNISVEDILAENPGLNSENFRIGIAIRIPKEGSSTKNNINSNPIQDTNYKTHKVGGKETLYSLSKLYNISMQEIADLNPDIKSSGLKKDMMLRIPKANTETANVILTNNTNPQQPQNAYEVSNAKVQIGLLLPFLDKKDHMQARFIEYYEGFLLAVEEIKKNGYSADIYVFDIRKGDNTKKLQSLLETTEIKNLDLIIGGVTEDEIALLSRFAENNNVKYVVPFPIKNSNVIAGDNTYMANLPQTDLYNKVAEKFATTNRENNIIIISDNAPHNDKADFIINVREALSRNYMSSKTVQAGQMSTELKDAVSLSKKNILVPSSSSLVSLGKVVSALKTLKTEYPAIEVGLFGYPDWQSYYSQFLTDFFKYNTYIYTPFYASNSDEEVKEFHQRYQKWYNKSLIQTFPKYGMLGYDTGLYFLTAIASAKLHRGVDTKLNANVPTIQSTFYFENAINNKGYINTGLLFIHYDQASNNINKIDHSR